MLKLKETILKKLKCVRCEGYLRVAPIMITPDKCQICGKCFKILPLSDKENCVRQEAYETVAEMLLFPCRYNFKGCQFQFSFNEVNNHELECSYRFKSANETREVIYEDISFFDNGESTGTAKYDYCNGTQFKSVISDAADNINVETNFRLYNNRISNAPSLLKYNIHIWGKSDTFLQLSNSQLAGCTKSPIKITAEGAISLTSLQDVFSKVNISDCPTTSDTYANRQTKDVVNKRESLAGYPKCVKCYKAVKQKIFHCSFGHNVCNTCKISQCTLCTSPVNSVPLYYCQNFIRGCLAYLSHTDVYLHSKDCEYGNFACPIDPQSCETLETLFNLKEHLRAYHRISDSSSAARQSSKKDEFWIILAFDDIFKCKFFYYETTVEIIVELIGSHKNSEKYKYEVVIESQQKNAAKILRTSKCANWKSSVLEQCVLITSKELRTIRTNIEQFTYVLNILNS